MGNSDKNILTIHLNINEGKIVFEALAELPFKYVFDLIGRLNKQVNESVIDEGDEEALCAHTLSRQELNMVIRALGEMQFNRVHALLENLNAQIKK